MFSPEKPISRQNAVVALHKISKLVSNNTEYMNFNIQEYPDYNDIDEYAIEAIKWSLYNNIINRQNNRINPKGYMINAESIVIIERFLKAIRFIN